MSVTGGRSASGGGGGGGGVKDCGDMDRKLLRLIGNALALRGVGVYACASDDGAKRGGGGDGSTNDGASSGKGRDSSSGRSLVCVNMT